MCRHNLAGLGQFSIQTGRLAPASIDKPRALLLWPVLWGIAVSCQTGILYKSNISAWAQHGWHVSGFHHLTE